MTLGATLDRTQKNVVKVTKKEQLILILETHPDYIITNAEMEITSLKFYSPTYSSKFFLLDSSSDVFSPFSPLPH
jgi:hypothetical protein